VAGEHEPQPLRAAPRRQHDHEELDCAAAAEEQEAANNESMRGNRLDYSYNSCFVHLLHPAHQIHQAHTKADIAEGYGPTRSSQ